MFSVTKPRQHVDASLTGYAVAATASTARNLDSVSTAQVCRVCLAMSVKMYHMSEHKLSVMYERVTGVVINTEDMLPKMLCWECVARLSSAHNFLEKTLKTYWLLDKELKCSKMVTISDIESIDRAQYQLVSTLGFNYNKENSYDFHIVEEGDEIYENLYDKENFNYCEDDETKYCELNGVDLNNEDATIITTNITNDKDLIKMEYLDVNEEQNFNNIGDIGDEKDQLAILNSDAHVSTKESISDEDVDNVNGELCNEENQTQQRKTRMNEDIPRKEPRVVLEDIMIILSKHNTQEICKQPADTDESSNEYRTICHPPIKRDVLAEKNNFAQKMSLNKDTGIADESLKNVLICDICGKHLQSKTNLRQHLRKHPKMYSCTYCTYKTVKKSNLNIHVNAKHTKRNTYECSLCSYKTSYKACLHSHVNAKHTKTIVYDCSLCSYKAYYKLALRTHVNARHTKTNVYNCSFCNYKAYDKKYLARHLKATHSTTKDHKCSYCSYKSNRKDKLKEHVNAKHTQTNVYNCSICSYRAFKKSYLVKHVNAKHTKTI